MSNKKGLLPIVNEEIGLSVQRELLELPGNKYFTDILERLQEDNPCVANFIPSWGIPRSLLRKL